MSAALIEKAIDQWVSIPKVCEITSQGLTFIREISSGRLPSIKCGRSRRVTVSALQAWMARFNGSGEIE